VTGAQPLLAGDPAAIGPYQLSGRLRAGSTGTVFLARRERGEPVELRTIEAAERGRPGFRAQLAAQVDTVRQVARFGLAPVLDADLDAALPYLVSEHVDGPSLEAFVAERGRLSETGLEGLAVGVARALAAIHAAGAVHGDLRPGLVVLSDVGVRVVDFGIVPALEYTVGLTALAQRPGSAAYVAPEQLLGTSPGADGSATPAADVYAWGALMVFAATGRAPFGAGSDATVAYRAIHGAPDLGALPRALREAVEAAMAPDPAARPSASALLERLTGGPASLPASGTARRKRTTRHAGRTPAEARRARRRARLAVSAVLGLLAGTLASAAVAWQVALPRLPAIKPWNPPASVAPNPAVVDDFSRPRDWADVRRDETGGATWVRYEGGHLRATTADDFLYRLGPQVAIRNASTPARVGAISSLKSVHMAIDVTWVGGSRWGVVALDCSFKAGMRFYYDGTVTVVRQNDDELVLAKRKARLADPGAPRRVETTCDTTKGGLVRLTGWVNGLRVVEVTAQGDPEELTDLDPRVGLAATGAQADVRLDDFLAWINPP
jgi:hypothetical protein